MPDLDVDRIVADHLPFPRNTVHQGRLHTQPLRLFGVPIEAMPQQHLAHQQLKHLLPAAPLRLGVGGLPESPLLQVRRPLRAIDPAPKRAGQAEVDGGGLVCGALVDREGVHRRRGHESNGLELEDFSQLASVGGTTSRRKPTSGERGAMVAGAGGQAGRRAGVTQARYGRTWGLVFAASRR